MKSTREVLLGELVIDPTNLFQGSFAVNIAPGKFVIKYSEGAFKTKPGMWTIGKVKFWLPEGGFFSGPEQVFLSSSSAVQSRTRGWSTTAESPTGGVIRGTNTDLDYLDNVSGVPNSTFFIYQLVEVEESDTDPEDDSSVVTDPNNFYLVEWLHVDRASGVSVTEASRYSNLFSLFWDFGAPPSGSWTAFSGPGAGGTTNCIATPSAAYGYGLMGKFYLAGPLKEDCLLEETTVMGFFPSYGSGFHIGFPRDSTFAANPESFPGITIKTTVATTGGLTAGYYGTTDDTVGSWGSFTNDGFRDMEFRFVNNVNQTIKSINVTGLPGWYWSTNTSPYYPVGVKLSGGLVAVAYSPDLALSCFNQTVKCFLTTKSTGGNHENLNYVFTVEYADGYMKRFIARSDPALTLENLPIGEGPTIFGKIALRNGINSTDIDFSALLCNPEKGIGPGTTEAWNFFCVRHKDGKTDVRINNTWVKKGLDFRAVFPGKKMAFMGVGDDLRAYEIWLPDEAVERVFKGESTGLMLDIVELTVADQSLTWFKSQNNYPPGEYGLKHVAGAYRNNALDLSFLSSKLVHSGGTIDVIATEVEEPTPANAVTVGQRDWQAVRFTHEVLAPIGVQLPTLSTQIPQGFLSAFYTGISGVVGQSMGWGQVIAGNWVQDSVHKLDILSGVSVPVGGYPPLPPHTNGTNPIITGTKISTGKILLSTRDGQGYLFNPANSSVTGPQWVYPYGGSSYFTYGNLRSLAAHDGGLLAVYNNSGNGSGVYVATLSENGTSFLERCSSLLFIAGPSAKLGNFLYVASVRVSGSVKVLVKVDLITWTISEVGVLSLQPDGSYISLTVLDGQLYLLTWTGDNVYRINVSDASSVLVSNLTNLSPLPGTTVLGFVENEVGASQGTVKQGITFYPGLTSLTKVLRRVLVSTPGGRVWDSDTKGLGEVPKVVIPAEADSPVTASSNTSEAWKALNAVGWNSLPEEAHFISEQGDAKKLRSYSFELTKSHPALLGWKVQGSNDFATWVDLDVKGGSVSSLSTWQPQNSPEGMWTAVCVSSDGYKILAFGYSSTFRSRVYYSSNGGQTFSNVTPVGMPLMVGGMQNATMSRNGRIFAIAGVGGIAVSVDAGQTWAWRSVLSHITGNVWGIAMSDDGSVVYVTGTFQGSVGKVLKSTNGEPPWTEVFATSGLSLNYAGCSADGVHVAVASNAGLRVSHDSGGTWTTYQPTRLFFTASVSDNGQGILASGRTAPVGQTTPSSIHISTDGGATFMENEVSGFDYHGTACSADFQELIVGSAFQALKRSSDFGTSWTTEIPQFTTGVLSASSVGISSDGSFEICAPRTLTGRVYQRGATQNNFQPVTRYSGLVSGDVAYVHHRILTTKKMATRRSLVTVSTNIKALLKGPSDAVVLVGAPVTVELVSGTYRLYKEVGGVWVNCNFSVVLDSGMKLTLVINTTIQNQIVKTVNGRYTSDDSSTVPLKTTPLGFRNLQMGVEQTSATPLPLGLFQSGTQVFTGHTTNIGLSLTGTPRLDLKLVDTETHEAEFLVRLEFTDNSTMQAKVSGTDTQTPSAVVKWEDLPQKLRWQLYSVGPSPTPPPSGGNGRATLGTAVIRLGHAHFQGSTAAGWYSLKYKGGASYFSYPNSGGRRGISNVYLMSGGEILLRLPEVGMMPETTQLDVETALGVNNYEFIFYSPVGDISLDVNSYGTSPTDIGNQMGILWRLGIAGESWELFSVPDSDPEVQLFLSKTTLQSVPQMSSSAGTGGFVGKRWANGMQLVSPDLESWKLFDRQTSQSLIGQATGGSTFTACGVQCPTHMMVWGFKYKGLEGNVSTNPYYVIVHGSVDGIAWTTISDLIPTGHRSQFSSEVHTGLAQVRPWPRYKFIALVILNNSSENIILDELELYLL